MSTLMQNIEQSIQDFNSIKQAIVNKGIEVPDGTKTSEYGNLIDSIAKPKEHIKDNLIYYIDLSTLIETEKINSVIKENLFSNINTITYEVCFQYSNFYDSSNKGRIWEIAYNQNGSLLYGLSLYNENAEFNIYQYDTSGWSLLENASGIIVSKNTVCTISCVIDNTNVYLYKNGELISTFEKFYNFSSIQDLWYMSFKGSINRTDRDTKTVIYSARVYNKALNADEVFSNYSTDITKYKGV